MQEQSQQEINRETFQIIAEKMAENDAAIVLVISKSKDGKYSGVFGPDIDAKECIKGINSVLQQMRDAFLQRKNENPT